MRKSKPKFAIIANNEVVSFNLTKFCNDNSVSQYKMKKYRKVTLDGIEYKLEVL